jgi:hypothetical protein
VTDPEAVGQAIGQWFVQAQLASLELPRGWFGRPHDNLHQLTWSAARDRKVLVELDGLLLLIITDPGGIESNDLEFRINGCAQVTLDWREYGNLRPHVEDHGGGLVRFVAGSYKAKAGGSSPPAPT